ncbi:MAG: hypothetical protein AB7F59_03100 [Bdellovibrionales bacterium]
MKPSKDLTEINKVLSPNPALTVQKERGNEAYEIKEERLFSQLDKLKEQGLSLPLSYFFSQKGLYVRFYFASVDEEFSFFISTNNQRHILKRLQENLLTC